MKEFVINFEVNDGDIITKENPAILKFKEELDDHLKCEAEKEAQKRSNNNIRANIAMMQLGINPFK